MSDEALICPDCGGYLGLTPGDERPACRCFSQAPKAEAPASTLRPAIARMMEQSERLARRNAGELEAARVAAEKLTAARAANLSSPAAKVAATSGSASADAPIALSGDSAAGQPGLADSAAAGNASSDTATIDASTTGPEKRCRVCGKDLAGHRRIKDSLGYICRECAKAEAPPTDPDRRPCPECERLIKPGGFVPYNGKHICRRCFADHMELDKYKKAAPSASAFVHQEKQSLTRLMIFAGVLFMLMLWSAYKHFIQK